ncbi:hypothetical protein FZEAL_8574 [Fusarium zealandicum]|uniref:Uncharacterized protein n=1 Tax=Fusarium zealandicum TaxID=1053134 RepID=A0A8H4UDL2_9HYPO|nr:hypothetical protein FZEAL_8574 [Fusarium zealandicum]
MHFSNIFAAAAILASSAMATPVDLEARKSIEPSPAPTVNIIAVTGTDLRFQTRKEISIQIGKLTLVDNLSITELRVKSVSAGRNDIPVPKVDNVVCQRYVNEYGTVVGSALFTKAKPAFVTTNAIPLKWLMCYAVKN